MKKLSETSATARLALQDRSLGFKWPVSVQRAIAAPAPAVWAAISQPGNLELCHPFCESNPVHAWPGPDSRDEVHYLSGLVYERRFLTWHDGVGYDLEIGKRGGATSHVSWRIRPIDDHRCALRITVCAHVLQKLPATVRWIPHLLWLRPKLRKYLDCVVRGFDTYVTRHRPVSNNEFGTHPWFSAK